MSKTKQIILKVLLPLLIGGMIYILFRQDNLKMFDWLNYLGLEPVIKFLRANITLELPDWIIYSLPDGIWIFALMNLMIILWKGEINSRNFIWLMMPFSFAVLNEIGQGLGFVTGTFSYPDLLFYLIGGIIPLLSIKESKMVSDLKFKNLRHCISIFGFVFFIFLDLGCNGPADAVQDMYIQDEKDPVKKEKMRRLEEWYHRQGRHYPTTAQTDSIYAAVDAAFSVNEKSKEKPGKKSKKKKPRNDHEDQQ